MATPRTTDAHPLGSAHVRVLRVRVPAHHRAARGSRSRRAVLVDFAGWLMPLRYGSEKAEHMAVREAAGIFDLSHMGEIRVTGPQAAAALDHSLIGHLSKVKVGRARYTMLTDASGGVLDDLIV